MRNLADPSVSRAFAMAHVGANFTTLVLTLARAHSPEGQHDGNPRRKLWDLTEQAADLFSPLLNYESAAREAGWVEREGEWLDLGDPADPIHADNAQDACDKDGIEPHQREVYAIHAVSLDLANALEARGERVDRDFAGHILWARAEWPGMDECAAELGLEHCYKIPVGCDPVIRAIAAEG